MKKEEIINEGLQLASDKTKAPKVKLEIMKKKHEENFSKNHCKWCEEKLPFSDELCSIRYGRVWELDEDNE